MTKNITPKLSAKELLGYFAWKENYTMNLNENGRLLERAHNTVKTIQKRFYKVNITKYFRICRCSENSDSWENSTSPLGAWTRPEIRTKQNNHISICFVLELNRVHSTTTICVTMLTRPLSRVSVEKLIKKTIIVWILILYSKEKKITLSKNKDKRITKERPLIYVSSCHWLTHAYLHPGLNQ